MAAPTSGLVSGLDVARLIRGFPAGPHQCHPPDQYVTGAGHGQ
jgi:hypothetical protein